MIIDAVNALAQIVANALGKHVSVIVVVRLQTPDRDGDPCFSKAFEYEVKAKPAAESKP